MFLSESFSSAMYAAWKFVSFLEVLCTEATEIARLFAGIKTVKGKRISSPAAIVNVFGFQSQHFIKIFWKVKP